MKEKRFIYAKNIFIPVHLVKFRRKKEERKKRKKEKQREKENISVAYTLLNPSPNVT